MTNNVKMLPRRLTHSDPIPPEALVLVLVGFYISAAVLTVLVGFTHYAIGCLRNKARRPASKIHDIWLNYVPIDV